MTSQQSLFYWMRLRLATDGLLKQTSETFSESASCRVQKCQCNFNDSAESAAVGMNEFTEFLLKACACSFALSFSFSSIGHFLEWWLWKKLEVWSLNYTELSHPQQIGRPTDQTADWPADHFSKNPVKVEVVMGVDPQQKQQTSTSEAWNRFSQTFGLSTEYSVSQHRRPISEGFIFVVVPTFPLHHLVRGKLLNRRDSVEKWWKDYFSFFFWR
jgi:hypothetical protein